MPPCVSTGRGRGVGEVWAGTPAARRTSSPEIAKRERFIAANERRTAEREFPPSRPSRKSPAAKGPPESARAPDQAIAPPAPRGPGEELLDRVPEVGRGRELRDPDPQRPAVRAGRGCTSRSSCAACGAPRSGRGRLLDRRKWASMRSRRSASVASRTGRPASRSAICRKIQGFFIVARPIMTASQPVSRRRAPARPRASRRRRCRRPGSRRARFSSAMRAAVGAAREHLPRGARVHRDGGDALVLADPAELEEVLRAARRGRGGT